MVAVVNLNPRLWSPRAIMHGLQHDECGNYTSCKMSGDIRTLSILGAVSIRRQAPIIIACVPIALYGSNELTLPKTTAGLSGFQGPVCERELPNRTANRASATWIRVWYDISMIRHQQPQPWASRMQEESNRSEDRRA